MRDKSGIFIYLYITTLNENSFNKKGSRKKCVMVAFEAKCHSEVRLENGRLFQMSRGFCLPDYKEIKRRS